MSVVEAFNEMLAKVDAALDSSERCVKELETQLAEANTYIETEKRLTSKQYFQISGLQTQAVNLKAQLAEANARAERAEGEKERLLRRFGAELNPEGDTFYERVIRATHSRDMNTRAEAIAECHKLRDENARLREAVQDFLHNYENDVRHERQGQVVHMYIAHEGMMIKKMRAALEPNHE